MRTTGNCALTPVAAFLQGRFLLGSPGDDGNLPGLAVEVPSGSREDVFRAKGNALVRSAPSYSASGLKGYLVTNWSTAELSPAAMTVATVTAEDPIGHRC